ncbi:Ig-like domain-containing protein [uncultured Methanobrevibacter sp.]|uniref:Ig-like domain-containing protein n=1 Tax=uncultured Methanobrevibacter sp. TaxID=253161 RepID=UPI0025D3FAE3|nr:Ig-like domain-containing protein [uncultured Methanobrevibacter sp.]
MNGVDTVLALDENGAAQLVLTNVEPGIYNVVVVYDGDNTYDSAVTTGSFNVAKESIDANITVPSDIKAGEEAVIDIAIPGATGNVSVFVDGVENVVPLDENGTAQFIIPAAESGEHSVVVVYLGDDTHDAAVATGSFSVEKVLSEANITLPSDVKAGEEAVIDIAIPGATGNVSVIVDGVETVVALDENGTAKYTVPAVGAGDHSVVVVYPGDDTNAPVVKSATFSADKETTEANVTMPTDFKVGEQANVTVDIPGATGNVSVIVDGVETVVPLDENGTAVVPMNMTPGEHSVVVVYSGDETHSPVIKTATVNAEVVTSQFTNLVLDGNLVLSGVLVDSLGNAIANATIDYTIGTTKGTLTTGADGSFKMTAQNNAIVAIAYAGTPEVAGTNIDITIQNIAPSRLGSEFNVTEGISIKTYAVDSPAGEIGQTTSFRLTDSNGKPIVNATVKFAYKTVILNRTTDENGIVFIGINTQVAQEALCAMSYIGDENYNATFVAFSFDIQSKPITISAPSKTYKASATKKYTVTIKTEKCNSRDGKVYLSAGKKITMKINGKTYTAKTNAKGQATFNLNISKKGKYTASIKFAGDKTYASASKSAKITVK